MDSVTIDLAGNALHAPGRTIVLSTVAGAAVEVVPANRGAGIVVALVGIAVGAACLASGGEAQGAGLLFGLLSVVTGAVMAAQAHERYRVRVDLVSGKVHRIASTRDRAEADGVVEEINAAAGLRPIGGRFVGEEGAGG